MKRNKTKNKDSSKLSKSDKLRATGKITRGLNSYKLRATGKKIKTKKIKKTKKIIDIPFSKYKSKGTKATLGDIEYHYQEYRNIKNFFKSLKLNFNYKNPILHLYVRKKEVSNVSIPELIFDKKFNIVIINLNTEDGENHANIALVDNKHNKIEFYEPHGYMKYQSQDGINNFYFKKYKLLKEIFSNILPNHSFVDAVSYNKKTSFQSKLDPDENTGFCIVWCILFIHFRLLNTDILLPKLMKYIDKTMTTNKLLKYARYVEETIKKYKI